jgi:hypothetical protein
MRKRIVLERDVENKFLRLFKAQRPDAQAWKQNGLGHAARPDRQVILAAALTGWIEFKRPGEYPTKAQQEEMDRLETLNHNVAACDNAGDAMDFIEDMELGKVIAWRTRWENNHT